MPFDFTDDEWKRPHGDTVTIDGERYVWDSAAMLWRIYSLSTGRHIRTVYPDHERARADPASAPVFALLHRITSPKRKHLRVVKPD